MVFGFAYVYNMLPNIFGSSSEPITNDNIVKNLSITSETLQEAKMKLKKTGANLFSFFEENNEEISQISLEKEEEVVIQNDADISLFPGRNAPNGISISKILSGEFRPHERMVRVITVSKETICETINKLRPTKINEHTPISSKNATLKELDAAFAMGVFNFLKKKVN